MEAEIKNYLDAKEIAGILAMNGYRTVVEPIEHYGENRTTWKIKFSRE